MALYPYNAGGDLPVDLETATTAVTTSVTLTNPTVKLLSANSNRKFFIISNTSGGTVQIGFSNALNGTVFAFQIPNNSFLQFQTTNPWVGEVWGFAANPRTVTVTEFT